VKIIPDNPSGTSEWNDAEEMRNTISTFNSAESIVVGIAFVNNDTPLEDEEEMESNEDSDNSTIDEPPNILEDIFGGLQLVDAPVIDAGSIVVHRNHRETIDVRNAFFRLVDRPGFPPMVVFTPPLPSTRVVADSFLSSTNHDPQGHRNLDGTVNLVFTSEYIREFYALVAPFIPWSPRQFLVWVPPHVLDFVPETPKQAVICETELAHRRWNRYKMFMIFPLYDYVWQPPALDQLPPESIDPRGQFVWSQFPYSARFEFDWRAFPTWMNPSLLDIWLFFSADVTSAVEHYETKIRLNECEASSKRRRLLKGLPPEHLGLPTKPNRMIPPGLTGRILHPTLLIGMECIILIHLLDIVG
jgi:hypothetical protein